MTDLIKELRGLRTRLSVVLNDEAKATLLRAERELAGRDGGPPAKPLKKAKPIRRLTKKQLYDKYNSKGLI